MTNILNFDLQTEMDRQRRENVREAEQKLVMMGDGRGRDLYGNLIALNPDGSASQELWVRDIGGDDGSGYTAGGQPYRVLPGVGPTPQIDKLVWIKWQPGLKKYRVDISDPDYMIAVGQSLHLENPSAPENQFMRTEQLLPLRSQLIGDGKANVQGYQYVWNGIYYDYAGTDEDTHPDILTVGQASLGADEQRYVLLVYNYDLYSAPGDNPIEAFVSAPIDAIADTLDRVDINACIAQMNPNSKPICVYRVSGGDVELYGHMDDRDLRDWLNLPLDIPDGSIGLDQLADGTPNTLLGFDGSGDPAYVPMDNDPTFSSPSSSTVPTTSAVEAFVAQTVLGLAAKADVRLATAAALPANTYANGSSGVGATLTGSATGVLTVDGVTVALNDRILVKDESAAANNGIYKCTTAGAIGVAYVLTRTTDGDTDTELRGGWMVSIEGTANATQAWVNTNTSAITFGSTSITFGQFSAGVIAAGDGLQKSGNTISVDSTVARLTTAQNISNKTITASSLVATALSILLGGFQGILTHANSADRTYTFPNYDGTMATLSGTETFANKVLSQLHLLIGGFKGIFTHSNTADRTYTFPNYNATISPATTKGDISAFNGTDNTRLPVGLDYQPLIADSSASTGLSYGAPASDLTVTWGEGTVSNNMAMYLRESDGKWYKASSSVVASPIRMSGVRGFAVDAGTGAINTTGKVRISGPMAGFTGLTAGKPVWVDSTNGSYTTTAPSTAASGIEALMGLALTSTTLFVGPQNPVLYRTAAGGVAQGTITTVTHHSDSALRRSPKAREVVYSDTVQVSYASSNQDTNVSLGAAAGSSVTINSGGTSLVYIGTQGGVTRRAAQAITPSTTARLISFTASFGANGGTPSGTVTWRLETDSSDAPSGTLIAAGATGTFTPTASSSNVISITGFPQLTASTKVWVTLTSTSTQTNGNYWQVQYDTAGGYAGGSLKFGTEGGAWSGGGGTNDMRSSFVTAVTTQLAQSYTASSIELVTRARLWMKKTGAPTYDLRVGFYTDSGGVPGTVIGSSGRVSASTLSTSYGWVEFTIYASSTIIQNPSTVYHVVLDAPDGAVADASNYVEWGADSSSPSFTGAMSAYASSTWQNIVPTTDACFEVYVQLDDYQESMEEGSFTRVTGDWAYQYGDASDGANAATVTRFKSTRTTPTLPIYEVEVP